VSPEPASSTPSSTPLAPEARGYRRLLELLDESPVQAERKYRQLREKLIRLFLWRGRMFPEDLADETLTRVARKVGEGLEIRAEDPLRYCCGVAFRVFKETVREREARRRQAAELQSQVGLAEPAEPEEPDVRHRCLRDCLDRMNARSRALILRYYQEGQGGTHIETRKRLAEELRIPQGALRSRARRIRAKLEACLVTCLRRDGSAPRTQP